MACALPQRETGSFCGSCCVHLTSIAAPLVVCPPHIHHMLMIPFTAYTSTMFPCDSNTSLVVHCRSLTLPVLAQPPHGMLPLLFQRLCQSHPYLIPTFEHSMSFPFVSPTLLVLTTLIPSLSLSLSALIACSPWLHPKASLQNFQWISFFSFLSTLAD